MKSIKTYSLNELTQVIKDLGQPSFRASQIAQWLYLHHISSFEEMTNLSKSLRDSLADQFSLYTPSIFDKQVSMDGSRKYILELEDGSLIETVGIPSFSLDDGQQKRLTVCFSTQVGCPIACAFCATGQEGFTRNLSIGEIVDQILTVQKDFGIRVTNIVAMGQGEPFLNIDNLLGALQIINHPKLLKIGARRITVSTCGILSGIERFAAVPEQFTLAVSLHSARQYTRDIIMPHMKNQPLSQLKPTLLDYIEKTNRRVTFEYLLLKDINDTKEDLESLIEFCDGILCHINLLPLNPVSTSHFKPSSQETVIQWQRELERNHIETTLRQSRGKDIAGACGQLKNSITTGI